MNALLSSHSSMIRFPRFRIHMHAAKIGVESVIPRLAKALQVAS